MSSPNAQYRLGIAPDSLSPANRSETVAIITALIEQAQHQLLVMADSLDPLLFDNQSVSAALQSYVARRPRQPARWLIEDGASLPRHAPRLVEMCRRFGSFIKIHQPAEEEGHEAELFIVADDCGYLLQPFTGQPLFKASFHSSVDAARLKQRFEERWQRSMPVAEIRVAGL